MSANKKTPDVDDTTVQILTHITDQLLSEQRRSRRWGIVFKLALMAYLAVFLVAALAPGWEIWQSGARAHAGLARIEGKIAANAKANADRIIKGLRAAYDNQHMQALVLEIDSPGGSPVQAEMIHRELKRLKKDHPDQPIVAVIDDLGASAAYYIAAAADDIYASRASLVGSIGVRLDGFGFDHLINAIGIERRLYAAGEHKGLLDPFLPVDAVAEARVRKSLADVHRQFIDVVREGRGERLADDDSLFSGLFWTGEEALSLGLVDGIGDRRYVLSEVLDQEHGIDYTPLQWSHDLREFLGATLARGLHSVLAEWTAWHLQ